MNGGSFVVAEKAASVDGHKRGKTERGEEEGRKEEGRKKKEGRRKEEGKEEGKKYRSTESSVSHFSHCAQ